MHTFIGIILAAGAGSRMGGPKALLRFDDGATLLERQCGMLLEGGCSRIGVVIGAAAPEIRLAHPAIPARWLLNELWEQGQFTSLQIGIKGMHATESDGAVVLPVDVAGVSDAIISALIDAAICNPHLDAIIPEYNGRGGHPVLLSSRFCELLAGLDPSDERSRLDVQMAANKNTLRVPVGDPHVVKNINTPDEWESYRKTAHR